MKQSLIKKIAALTFVYAMLIVIYIPIIILIVFSFTNARIMGQWTGFSFDLYIQLFFDQEIMGALANTLIIAAVSSLLATLIGTVSAVGIFYLKKIPKAIATNINQITVINADIVTGVAFMLFFLAVRVIPLGYITLIISHTMITVPYVILSVLPRLGQLNPNTYEAGLDVGASPVRTLFTVVMPQLIPAMISGFALAFTLSLDDFVITKFNNGKMVDTISTYIYNKLAKKGIDPLLKSLSALIMIVSLAILLVVNIYNKRKSQIVKK